MADTAAHVALTVRRNEVARFAVVVTGLDLTGVDMKMQVRLGRGNPQLLFALGTVGSAAAEGLKLDGVTFTNGVPTSIIKGRINASTMTDPAKVPYAGGTGSDQTLAYAMTWTLDGDTQVRLEGPLVVVDSAYNSDGAPSSRQPSSRASTFAGGPLSGTLQFGDQVVQVTIDGVAAAIAAVQPSVDAAKASALVAKGWADDARQTRAEFPAYFQGDPGANVMSVGLFSTLGNKLIPVGTDLIQTSGATRGVLIADDTLTDANAAAHPLAIVKTGNGRFFRRDPNWLWGEQFGMRSVEDKSFDSAPGLRAALAYGSFCGRPDPLTGNSTRGVPDMRFGVGRFYLATRSSVRYAGTLHGYSRGHSLATGGTVFACEESGLLFERQDTDNFTKITQPPYKLGSDGVCIDGISLLYVGPNAMREGGRNGAFAVTSKCNITARNCGFLQFPGPGLHILATSGADDPRAQGEASGSNVTECIFDSCWADLWLEGGDVNVIHVANNVFAGAYYGVLHEAFLSSYFTNNHFKGNGTIYSYNGQRWQCLPGKEAQASTTPPGSNPLVWAYVEDGGPYDFFAVQFYNCPQWVSGMAIRQAGSACHYVGRNTRTVFNANYWEGTQAKPVIAFPAIIIGGQFQNVARESGGDAVFIQGEQGAMSIGAMHIGDSLAYGIDFASRPDGGFIAMSGQGQQFPLVLRTKAQDWAMGVSFSDVGTSIIFTGEGTAQAFGRNAPLKYAAAFPNGLVMGSRRWKAGFPAGDYAATGELYFDQDGGNRVGWKCVTAGVISSTAVLKEFNTIN